MCDCKICQPNKIDTWIINIDSTTSNNGFINVPCYYCGFCHPSTTH